MPCLGRFCRQQEISESLLIWMTVWKVTQRARRGHCNGFSSFGDWKTVSCQRDEVLFTLSIYPLNRSIVFWIGWIDAIFYSRPTVYAHDWTRSSIHLYTNQIRSPSSSALNCNSRMKPIIFSNATYVRYVGTQTLCWMQPNRAVSDTPRFVPESPSSAW